MNKLLKISLLSVLALPVVTGCGNNKKSEKVSIEDVVNKQSELAFQLIGVSYAKFSSADGIGLAGAYLTEECITPDGFKFHFAYSVKAMSDEYMYDYVSLESDGLTVDVIIPEIWELPIENQLFAHYVLTGKATFVEYTKTDVDYSSLYKKETGTKDWNVKVNSMETRPVIEKISTVKTTHSDGDTVIVRGYISGYYQKSANDFYTGVFLSDGPHTVMLYSGSLSNYVNDLEIGTLCQVIADWSAYNGLVELKPQSGGIAILKNDQEISEPSLQEYTANQFVALKSGSSGNLCKVQNLTLKDDQAAIEALKPGEHWTLTAEADGKEIPIYVNYHIGKEAQEAIKTLLVVNRTKTFDFVGTVGYYNKPQLSPLVSFATQTAVNCFQFKS